jgi:hypothetical protein
MRKKRHAESRKESSSELKSHPSSTHSHSRKKREEKERGETGEMESREKKKGRTIESVVAHTVGVEIATVLITHTSVAVVG